jgi:tetratricopeptide (TPR) repeat protein
MTRADDTPPKPTAPELYKRAVAHLNAGREFEAAIADLTQAVKQDPRNSDYHLALGCAEVDRAGSLTYASWMRDFSQEAKKQYQKDLADWQTEPHDDPRPVTPLSVPRIPTKDDGQPLLLTKTQATARGTTLEQAAQSEWRQAVSLAKTRQARARAENVQGWGMQYERKMQGAVVGFAHPSPGVPEAMAVVSAFQASTKDGPADADAWEGLGNAYPYREYEDRHYAPEIIRAWQRALVLAPHNTALRYRLYRVEARAMPQAAQRLAASALDSSILQYGLASLLFQQVHYSDVYDAAIPNADKLTQAQLADQHEKVVQGLAAVTMRQAVGSRRKR